VNILYCSDKSKYITYHKHFATKKEAACVVFHHGFMSDMNGTKAEYIEAFCKQHDYNFIKFNSFGCGTSSGVFLEQTITTWYECLQHVIHKLSDDKQLILIGSSFGAWISALYAVNNLKQVHAIIGISSAFDFTEKLIRPALTPEQKTQLSKDGLCYVTGSTGVCNDSYPITKKLMQDAKHYLLLQKQMINLQCPIHLIHGMLDIDVPYSLSLQFLQKINHPKVVLKLIKDGDHKLSRAKDLDIICNSIKELS
jgi:hypothetical protein